MDESRKVYHLRRDHNAELGEGPAFGTAVQPRAASDTGDSHPHPPGAGCQFPLGQGPRPTVLGHAGLAVAGRGCAPEPAVY